MAYISKRNRRKEKEKQTTADNRRELIAAGFKRRDLLKMRLLTSAGMLIPKKGLSAHPLSTRGSFDDDEPNSPATTPFQKLLPRLPVLQSVSLSSLNPPPTAAPQPQFGEARTVAHQLWDFPRQRHYEMSEEAGTDNVLLAVNTVLSMSKRESVRTLPSLGGASAFQSIPRAMSNFWWRYSIDNPREIFCSESLIVPFLASPMNFDRNPILLNLNVTGANRDGHQRWWEFPTESEYLTEIFQSNSFPTHFWSFNYKRPAPSMAMCFGHSITVSIVDCAPVTTGCVRKKDITICLYQDYRRLQGDEFTGDFNRYVNFFAGYTLMDRYSESVLYSFWPHTYLLERVTPRWQRVNCTSSDFPTSTDDKEFRQSHKDHTKPVFECNVCEKIGPKLIVKTHKHPSAFQTRVTDPFGGFTLRTTWCLSKRDAHHLHRKHAKVKVSGIDPGLRKTTTRRTNFGSWHFVSEFRDQLRAATFTWPPPSDRFGPQRDANMLNSEGSVRRLEEMGIGRRARDCGVVGAGCRDLPSQNSHHPPEPPIPPPRNYPSPLKYQSTQLLFLESRSCSKRIAETNSFASYSLNFSQDGTAAYLASSICPKAG